MRPTALLRFLLPGLVAGLVWVVSDWLARLAFAAPGLLERTFLRTLAPDTMSVGADAPWPVGAITVLAWAVAVAAAFLVVTTLLRPLAGRAGFAAAWFAAIFAAAVVTGVAAVAAALAAIADPVARAQLSSESLAVAAHWGLVWGWLPAIAAAVAWRANVPAQESATSGAPDATDATATRVPARGRAVRAFGAAIALAVALSTIVALEPIAVAAWHVDLRAQEPELQPAPAPTATPVPEVAPGEWQVDPLWCTDNQLEFAASEPDSAAGSRGMRVVATNASQAACVLEGYPDVAFSDPVTSALDVRVEHGSAMGGDDAGPVRLELAPGDSATATIAWRAMAAAQQDPAGWLHIAPYHGGIRQMLQVETDITGGEVVVGAWAASPVGPGDGR